MKKIFTLLCVLVSMICTAVAQPAMISKGNVDGLTCVSSDLTCQVQETRDDLDVEIVFWWGDSIPHPVYESCPGGEVFKTSVSYASYFWETDLLYDAWMVEQDEFYVSYLTNGYLKVTVSDEYGNTGTDSIWFEIKDDPTYPMENFIMEIGDDLTPTFSGIATEDHYRLSFGISCNPSTLAPCGDFFLSPGEWIFNDQDAVYQEDTLWLYTVVLDNTCEYMSVKFYVPGLLLNTKKEDSIWYLDMRTLLQITDHFQNGFSYNCVYFVYTVDSQGQRHHFTDADGNLVILSEKTDTWQIPGEHVDPHYQCGVAKVLEDGTYELLSLSNKVENPLLAIDGIEEHQATFSLYPNPAQGHFTVEGTGTMTITNVLGQTVLTREIDGKESVELLQGIYFVRLNGATRKIVVE